ncbi:T9SS type A sorting domain-containing protein [Flavobacterium hydatis]|uniref:T9SS C-terminal target domain-containing protein n=1 Tax=Flavobacterium hydatis TaxID=991 RepID=A0A086AAZ5_FLAHY|nr:T9SS type A sorting domain-containing protein [Flavobacterium hydatis]KFF13859.1 hypothetical protein IW20_17465 [Flavobacterium hydatis]OXA84917.1 T9SS C-terminal target domain-containing protein [Flavobacterium hydatis]
MRKKYFYYIILIMFSPFIVAQTVSINSIYVNSVYSQSINLGSNSSSNVTLSVLVALPAAQSNSNPGTVNVYYKRNAAASAIVGGYGGNLLFNGGTNATRGFSIDLRASDFDTSGGFIYAEYKTFSGVVYKSGNISVIRNADSGGTPVIPGNVPDVTKIPNTLCCNQTIRQGDKPAVITGSDYANPYPDHPTYGIGSMWSVNGYAGVSILNSDSKTYSLDYVKDLSTFTVTRGLKYNNKFSSANNSNAVTITVVPSPITSNEISIDNAIINPDGFIEMINTNPKQINGSQVQVNLNILDNPFYTAKRGDVVVDVDYFEWEYANAHGKKTWAIISNENSRHLTSINPSEISNSQNNYYFVRRVAVYKGIRRASNELKIMIRTIRHDNTICCDQQLQYLSSTELENPTTIIGSTPIFQNTNISGNNSYYTISYQWQIQNTRGADAWSDIAGATSKDYLPEPLKLVQSNRGFTVQSTYNYRRIAKFDYQTNINGNWRYATESCYSNEVNLSSSQYASLLKIYPNPTSSILYLSSNTNLTNAKINIINTVGLVVNTNNYSLIDSNLISIDVSNLLPGIYFINIQGETPFYSLTFIKN